MSAHYNLSYFLIVLTFSCYSMNQEYKEPVIEVPSPMVINKKLYEKLTLQEKTDWLCSLIEKNTNHIKFLTKRTNRLPYEAKTIEPVRKSLAAILNLITLTIFTFDKRTITNVSDQEIVKRMIHQKNFKQTIEQLYDCESILKRLIELIKQA